MNDANDSLPDLVARVAGLLERRGALLVTAESCTGGLIAAACTERAGSSAWFERGFVSYSNEAKHEALGVDAALIEAHGAVSEPVARAMAEGGRARLDADLAVAITGVAGPGGGSAEKPVGLVHFGCASKGYPTEHRERRFGPLSRDEIRRLSVIVALEMLKDAAFSRR